MNASQRTRIRLALSVVCLACSASRTFAQPAKEAPLVTVQVRTILATKAHGRIDERLRPLAEQLKRTFQLTGFELRGETSKKVKLNEAARIDLPDPYRLEVTPVSVSDGKVTLQITVFEKKGRESKRKLDTKVTLTKGKSQLIGGLDVSGGQLVLAISGSTS